MKKLDSISGKIVDVRNQEIYNWVVTIQSCKIIDIRRTEESCTNYIMPGFVDSHVHIESSMLTPSEFSRIATWHGTIAAVCDPHEIANVLWVDGVRYMIRNALEAPMKFYFWAPSCVPATNFETSWASIWLSEFKQLMRMRDIRFVWEMMNFPWVVSGNSEILKMLKIAQELWKPIDWHAPWLKWLDLEKYIWAWISTDHECFSLEEALEKISKGLKILIREWSAAKNFESLIEAWKRYPDECMFCSDDKHPDDLIKWHINSLVLRALQKWVNLFDALRMACINPVKHYELEVWLLNIWDPADFIVVDNLSDLRIQKTVIWWEIVAENWISLIPGKIPEIVNNFKAEQKSINDFVVTQEGERIKVIEVIESQLVTNKLIKNAKIENWNVVSDIGDDILKIAVVNRYQNTKPAIWFIKWFNLKKWAIASSVAHDSHNIIVVWTNDEDICMAVNKIIENKWWICSVSTQDNISEILPLPIAGIISDQEWTSVAKNYTKVDTIAKSFWSKLEAPFMTLSFMALLVIPEIKLSDRWLFDGNNFSFMKLF